MTASPMLEYRSALAMGPVWARQTIHKWLLEGASR